MKKGVVKAIASRSIVSADNNPRNGLSPKVAVATNSQCMGNVTIRAVIIPAGTNDIQRAILIGRSIPHYGQM
jgi:hypothetical protein